MAYTIERRIPTFKGRHNAVKARCFITLLACGPEFVRRGYPGLNVKALAAMSRSKRTTIYTLVWRWHRWRYVKRKRHPVPFGGAEYFYSLAPKGKLWLQRNIPFMPVSRYVRELRFPITAIYGYPVGDNWQ